MYIITITAPSKESSRKIVIHTQVILKHIKVIDNTNKVTTSITTIFWLRRKLACSEVGDTLHELVSTTGTGNLNKLTVLPSVKSVAAIPVQAMFC